MVSVTLLYKLYTGQSSLPSCYMPAVPGGDLQLPTIDRDWQLSSNEEFAMVSTLLAYSASMISSLTWMTNSLIAFWSTVTMSCVSFYHHTALTTA